VERTAKGLAKLERVVLTKLNTAKGGDWGSTTCPTSADGESLRLPLNDSLRNLDTSLTTLGP
jgi:hypothetical protein